MEIIRNIQNNILYNNGQSKEQKKPKRIKGIKNLEFGFDFLHLIKQKDKDDLVYKNENKKKILGKENFKNAKYEENI